MLLPSLLPCDGANRTITSSQAPLILSQDLPMRHNPDDTLTSCRALQAMMGSPSPNFFSALTRPQRPKLMRSPLNTVLNSDATADPPRPQVRDRTLPFQSGRKHKLDEPAAIVDVPMQRERSVSSFSTTSTLATTSPVTKEAALQAPIASPMFDQENSIDNLSKRIAQDSQPSERPYATPKRRRLVPLAMPLGLSASDFESLNMPPGYGPQPSHPVGSTETWQQHHSSTEPAMDCVMHDAEGENVPYWDASDDLALVSLLLDKLRVSKRDWNECARILGKDKDSLSRRWRYLIGNGNLGLRRSNERGRGRLDVIHGELTA